MSKMLLDPKHFHRHQHLGEEAGFSPYVSQLVIAGGSPLGDETHHSLFGKAMRN